MFDKKYKVVKLTEEQCDKLMRKFKLMHGEKIIYHLELPKPEIEIYTNNGMTKTFIKLNNL